MRRLVPIALVALALDADRVRIRYHLGAAPTATGVGAAKLIAGSADKAAEREDRPHERRDHLRGRRARARTLPLDGALDFGSGAFEFNYDMSRSACPGASDAKFQARMVDGVMYLNFGDLRRAATQAVGRSPAARTGRRWTSARCSRGRCAAAGSATRTRAASSTRSAVRVTSRSSGPRRCAASRPRTTARPSIRRRHSTRRRPSCGRRSAKGIETFKGPLPVDVWIDGDGQARKIAMDMDSRLGSASR